MQAAKFANTTRELKHILNKTKSFLFDCDGVLWQGNEAIKGAVVVINKLKELGKVVLFVTNNSTKTRDEYVQKLHNLGFVATRNDVFPTAYTSALYLKHQAKVAGRVYVVGVQSLQDELKAVGIDSFGVGPDSSITSQAVPAVLSVPLEGDVSAVLVGFDGHLSFSKLLKSASYLSDEKCLFVVTNEDHRMPLSNTRHVIPGTGVMVQAVSFAASRKPDVVCGKPHDYMFQCIQNEVGIDPASSMMIGDRMNTDILFGRRHGMATLLVLSGVETADTLQAAQTDPDLSQHVPDYVLNSLNDWAELSWDS